MRKSRRSEVRGQRGFAPKPSGRPDLHLNRGGLHLNTHLPPVSTITYLRFMNLHVQPYHIDTLVTLQTAPQAYSLSIFSSGNADIVGILCTGGAATTMRYGESRSVDAAAPKEATIHSGEAPTRHNSSPQRTDTCSGKSDNERMRQTTRPKTAGRSKERKRARGRVMATDRQKLGDLITSLLDEERWSVARKTVQRELRKTPSDHWLLDRLSETYYNEGKLRLALMAIQRAYELNPECPLVLWDHANTLEAIGSLEASIWFYRHLMQKGLGVVACGECGEGLEWAESLLADTAYRMAIVCHRLKRRDEAFAYKLTCLSMRDQGASSIYDKVEVEQALASILPQTSATAKSAALPPVAKAPIVRDQKQTSLSARERVDVVFCQ